MALYIKKLPASDLEFQMFVMDELGDELITQGQDVIKLTIGISELPVPEPVKKVFSETVYEHEKTRLVYPQGLPALREAIAEYYNAQFHVNTTAHNVVVNVGTSAIFRNLFQLLSQSGQEIMLPRPYYCLYLLSAILADAKITYYDIDPITKKIDFASFERVYEPAKTAVVVLSRCTKVS